jgi:CTP:molybdopterin cytidylyltransferase MocA
VAAEGQVTVIVLAAQRDGELDPLAAAAGVSHKCLVPICGQPLLAHVLKALEGVAGIESVRISVEAGAAERLRPITDGSPLPIQFSESADNLADSVYCAAQGAAGAIIVTTADNVLVRAAPIEAVARRLLDGDDVVIAVARKEDIRAAHPDAQHNFYELRDGGFSNCNLYGASQRGLRAAEAFRGGGHFFKNPLRIAKAFGLMNLIRMRLGWVTTEAAMDRIGRRFRLKATRIILDDGAYAVDVDNERTYRIAALLMQRRLDAGAA